jgi:ATP phosphoribosyltransferase regulatory subunit
MKSKKHSEVLLKFFIKKGFKVKSFDNIIESKIIIERSGEIFKRSLLSFEDESGKSFSLRPDLTISACLDYLKNIKKGIFKYAYFDQAYRRTFDNDSLVRNQLGCEVIGSKDKKVDQDIINLIDYSLKKTTKKNTVIKLNDLNIFFSLVDSLDLPLRWKLRFKRHFWRPDYFQELLKRLSSNSDLDKSVFELDKKTYLRMKKMDQKKLIAGRSIKEILQRFEKKIREPRSKIEGKFISKILNEFLKIDCSLKKAKLTLETFEKKYQVNLNLNKINIFNFKLNNKNLIFSTNIGRTAEYYSGTVFEIITKNNNLNLASGGRYDSLMQVLGAKKSIPAIGGAINYNNIKS